MTTKTPIDEPSAPVIAALQPNGLQDGVDLARLANELFSAIPGADGFGRGPSAYGTDGAAAGVRQAVGSGLATPAPISYSGAGFSPTGLSPESFSLANVTAAERLAFGAPGAAIPPTGVSSVGPGDFETAPRFAEPGLDLSRLEISLAGKGFVPDLAGLQRQYDRFTPDLYILAESQTHQPANPARDRASGYQADHQTVAPEPSSPFGYGYPSYDVQAVRREFPILAERINGRPLIWLDNAATTQKPQAVIDRLAHFYRHENSNVHRGAHTLAARATDAYENAREIVARFLGATQPEEIIFVRGATEAINLVAAAWGRANVGAGDEIIISHLEHHANIVPWQQLAAEKNAVLKVIPVDETGQIRFDEYENLLSERTKIVAVTHVSNALGTVVPIKPIIDRAHVAGTKVLIDGAQSVAHERINLQWLDADFFVFSGHKIFGPTGIGVLYGKRELLDSMPPYQTGGNMIADVTFEKTTFQSAPARFEAGTGNLADAVGLGVALQFLERIGLDNIAAYEHELYGYATRQLQTVPGLRLFGSTEQKASVLSFLLGDVPPEEVSRALDKHGIAVRAGHHCAQPILRRFGVEGTVRASLALYNTHDEIDCLVSALRQIASASK